MSPATNSLRSALAGLSPREKRLLLAMGILFFVMLSIGAILWSRSALESIETERAAALDALRALRNERAAVRERRAVRDQMLLRYADRAPPLASFAEEIATETNIRIAEARDLPTPQPQRGQRFVKRSVQIRFRDVDLTSLVTFMNRVELAGFPIGIMSYRIRKRQGAPDRYDVEEMVISTWDRADANPSSPASTNTTTPSGGNNPPASNSRPNSQGGNNSPSANQGSQQRPTPEVVR